MCVCARSGSVAASLVIILLFFIGGIIVKVDITAEGSSLKDIFTCSKNNHEEAHISSRNKIFALLIILGLPTVDTFTNLWYLLGQRFYHPAIFGLCVIAFLHSIVIFVMKLWFLKATPFLPFGPLRTHFYLSATSTDKEAELHNLREILTEKGVELHNLRTTPTDIEAELHNLRTTSTEKEAELHKIRTTSTVKEAELHNIRTTSTYTETELHGGGRSRAHATDFPIPKFGPYIFYIPGVCDNTSEWLVACWMVISWIPPVLLQTLISFTILLMWLLFVIFWFCIGLVLQMTKLLSLGRLWNMWFFCWAGDVKYSVPIIRRKDDPHHKQFSEDIDTEDFNWSTFFHTVCETFPMLIYQVFNSVLLNEFNFVAILSIICSGFIVVKILWAIVHRKNFASNVSEKSKYKTIASAPVVITLLGIHIPPSRKDKEINFWMFFVNSIFWSEAPPHNADDRSQDSKMDESSLDELDTMEEEKSSVPVEENVYFYVRRTLKPGVKKN